MEQIKNLIWITHPRALKAAIYAAENEPQEEAENSASELLAALLLDDTFNEYHESELTAAIAEVINEYI